MFYISCWICLFYLGAKILECNFIVRWTFCNFHMTIFLLRSIGGEWEVFEIRYCRTSITINAVMLCDIIFADENTSTTTCHYISFQSWPYGGLSSLLSPLLHCTPEVSMLLENVIHNRVVHYTHFTNVKIFIFR